MQQPISKSNHKKTAIGIFVGVIIIFLLCLPAVIPSSSGLVLAQPAATPPDPTAPTPAAPTTPTKPDPTAPTKPDSSGGLENAGKVPLKNPLDTSDVFKLINRVITAGLGLTGILALIAFIYGGVLWMVSLGDAGKIEKGKKMLIWAVIGLAVVFTSYGAITLIFRALGIAGV